jgi:hypothetical protein
METYWVGGYVSPVSSIDVEEERNRLAPSTNKTPDIQPVDSHVIDWAMLADMKIFGVKGHHL